MKKTLLLLFIVVAQVLAGLAVHAQTVTLFDFGSQWRYLDDGSNQGTAWTAPSYSDASWSTGTGYFGYGDSWINTCLNAGCGTLCNPGGCSKRITTYFRKTINIPNPDIYTSITLSAYRDDGIVVYVNGVEVWREHMPGGTINYNTTASNPAIGGSDETTPVDHVIPISAFSAGDNVIAVELHQQSSSSSDCTFNMEAVGTLSTDLFAFGSEWRYLDNGSNQGTAWRGLSFNDASWSTGTGYFGYGDSWINTCINAGCGSLCNPGGCSKYITTYFRKNIVIGDVSYYDGINLSMYRDDGAVVYVNGVEVWREHMPGGTINYNTTANSPAIGGSSEATPVNRSIPISNFINGNNVIAVELHQQAASSSDMTFNMEAEYVLYIPPVPVNLVRGPYLQMGNQTGVSVRWRTDIPSKSRVEVGTTYGAYPIVVNDGTETSEHEVRVAGLVPDTKYYYRFGTDTSLLQGDTSNFFVTAPAAGNPRRVTLAAYGDCGRNDNGFQTGTLNSYRSYLSSIGLEAADIMMLVGDNAYNNGTDNEYQTGFFNAYSSTILKNHMLFPAPGNHDYAQSSARQNDHNVPYYDIFSLPTAGECGGVASGTEAYYSYDWGDVHVLSLDSYGREDGGSTRLYDTSGAQVNWIKADLAATNKKWIIAYWHHPPFTKGSHNSDTENELIQIRQNFIRILERYGVDVIICGHSHDYERSYLLKDYYGTEASFNVAAHAADNSSAKYNGSTNSCPYMTQSGKYNHGTVYVVSGSSGADGGVQSGYPHDAMPFSIDDGGMFFLDINENRLDAKFIRRNNTIGDQFTIMKDVNVTDTVEILHGESTELTATWQGDYTWGAAGTNRIVTVTPAADTVVEVKDDATNTCITDRYFVDMQCTTPDIISGPSNITRSGCDATVSYSITDTGRLNPEITYSFTGATTASGSGTGSGTVFNVGVTNVTITATNECGSDTHSFTVTIEPLPTDHNVTGGGSYCSGGTGVSIGLDGSQTGVNYQLYDGTTAIGSAVAGTGGAISFGMVTGQSTYSVVATDATSGCTADMFGSASVSFNALPVVQTVTGGGGYCSGGAGVAIGLANTQAGISYTLYDGSTMVGSPMTGAGSSLSFGVYTATGTYTVSATNTVTSCSSDMSGSAIVSINALPSVYNVTGGGSYCNGGSGVSVGINGSQTGVSYRMYNGSTPIGTAVAGTGAAVGFGSQTAGATYTVRATITSTGCAAEMSGNATVNVLPLPTAYNVSSGGEYCVGGAGVGITLDNSTIGVNYQLYYGTIPSGSVVAGTGSDLSFGMRTGAGGYTVSAVNTATGCANTMTGVANVTINSLPGVFALSGGGSYCSGGTGVAIDLGGTEPGVSYQLYNGTTMMGAALSGTGLPASFGTYTAAGTYSVLATNTTTFCATGLPSSVAISIIPLVTPSVAVSSITAAPICAGAPISLTATSLNGGASPTYEWSVNGSVVASGSSAGYSYVPSDTDVVSVMLTSSVACVTSSTATDDMVIYVLPNILPVANITVSPSDSVCEGEMVTFHVTPTHGGTSPSYTWLRNSVVSGTADTFNYAPAHGDVVLVSMNSTAPCRLADNVYSNVIDMKVDESFIPIVTIIAAPGLNIAPTQPVTFTAHVTRAGVNPTYQWSINGTNISGATKSSFTSGGFTDKDTVACVVVGGGLCGNETFNSVVMNVASVGIVGYGVSENDIKVTPNPTNGTFTVEGAVKGATDNVAAISVTNVLGQVVDRRTADISSGIVQEEITLDNTLANGLYLITIQTSVGNSAFHLVLKR